MTPSEHADLRRIEASRLRSLVDRDMVTAQRLHADDYVLITPRGARLSKTDYLAAVASGDLAYERFEAVSEVDVLSDGHDLAVLRYKSAIAVGPAGEAFSSDCWHTDCYRRDDQAGWQVVWSQATAIERDARQ